MEIYPSLISADLLNLMSVIRNLEPYCSGFHIDVMDDHFVPNLTWGPMFVDAFQKATDLPLHIHLMVDNPESFISRLNFRDKDLFVFHYEAIPIKSEMMNLLKTLKSKKIKIGLAIKPSTSPEEVAEYLSDLNQILLMSVEPGFSGQKFIDAIKDKIPFLIDYKKINKCSFKIAIDGGINRTNIEELKNLGVEQAAVASAIFSTTDPIAALIEISKK